MTDAPPPRSPRSGDLVRLRNGRRVGMVSDVMDQLTLDGDAVEIACVQGLGWVPVTELVPVADPW